MIIRGYVPKEAGAVDQLLRRAFNGAEEADLCVALRANGDMALELVAEDRGRIVGYVALSRMVSPKGWLALAPCAVDPKRQGRGIGSALCQMTVDYANAPVVVLGEPAFYTRFGFDYGRAGALKSSYPIEYTGIFAPEIEAQQPEETLVYAAPFQG